MTEFADPLFPVPEPAFLFVYDLLVWSQGPSVTVGAGHRWRWASAASACVGGYVAAPQPLEVERGHRLGLQVDCVALFPKGTVIDQDDEVEVPAAPVAGSGRVAAPPIFAGRYAVQQVRPNPSHVRVMLGRRAGEEPAHGG